MSIIYMLPLFEYIQNEIQSNGLSPDQINFNDSKNIVKPPLTDSIPIPSFEKIKPMQNNFIEPSNFQNTQIDFQQLNLSFKLPKDSMEFLLDADSDYEDSSEVEVQSYFINKLNLIIIDKK